MGMFDTITCKYPLPDQPTIDCWQTKSLDCTLDHYVIEPDGTLHHEDYDIEDQSDKAKGIGEDSFCGCMTKVNKRLSPMPKFRGEIVFYESTAEADEWFEYSAFFDDGKLLSVKRIVE